MSVNITLSRKKAHREHTVRNLAVSLILFEKIKTTEAKAKVTKSVVNKWITMARKDSLSARRQLMAVAFDVNAVKKLFEVLNKRYASHLSGLVKSTRVGNRLGDNAPMVLLELVNDSVQTSEAAEKEDKPKSVKKLKSAPKDNHEEK